MEFTGEEGGGHAGFGKAGSPFSGSAKAVLHRGPFISLLQQTHAMKWMPFIERASQRADRTMARPGFGHIITPIIMAPF